MHFETEWTRGEGLIIFWVRGHAIGKGIDLRNLGNCSVPHIRFTSLRNTSPDFQNNTEFDKK